MDCLVVDSSLTMRRIYSRLLEGKGFQRLLTAASAGSALELVRGETDADVGLVITERDLPDADGLELVKQIREKSAAELPVLMVASRNRRSDVLQALRAGVNAYVLKPLDADVFLDRLEVLVPSPAEEQGGSAGEIAAEGGAVPPKDATETPPVPPVEDAENRSGPEVVSEESAPSEKSASREESAAGEEPAAESAEETPAEQRKAA